MGLTMLWNEMAQLASFKGRGMPKANLEHDEGELKRGYDHKCEGVVAAIRPIVISRLQFLVKHPLLPPKIAVGSRGDKVNGGGGPAHEKGRQYQQRRVPEQVQLTGVWL